MKNTKLIIISASLIISFLTISSVGAETGLVGHWKMEDNWSDSSGNGNNGTGHGGVGFADGKVGRCGSYGNNKYVDVGDMDNPFDGSSSNMTISMWVKSGGSNSGTVGLVSKGVSGNAIFEFRFYSDDSFSLHARDPGGNNYVTVASGSFDDWVGNWHHISAVVELNPLNIKLYRDGVDLPTSSSSAGTPPTVWDDIPDSVEIGRLRWAVGTRYFNGLIDEVKIYNRTLSEEEIKAQYYLYLVALYHMDEDSWDGPDKVLDSFGNGNHGTAHGGAHPVASEHTTPGGYDYGNCGSFDGINDYIEIPMTEPSSLYTIEMWVYRNTDTDLYLFDARASGGAGYCYQAAGGVLVPSSGTVYVDTVETTTLGIGDWHHVAIKGITMSIPEKLILAHRHASTGKYKLNGKLDEVVIYNRILSEEEIQTHYEEGPPEGAGPIDLYKTEGSYLSSVKDAEKSVSWNKICWEEDANYGEELPNNKRSDSGADMSGNLLLMHMNEASGTIVDYSDEGNNGTTYGGVTYGVSGKFNTALSFDGINDYIEIPMTEPSSLYTIEMWVYRNTDTDLYLFDARASGGVGYCYQPGGGVLVPSSGIVYVDAVKTTSLMVGAWYHVVIKGITMNIPEKLILAQRYDLTPPYKLNGKLDEVAVYDRDLSSSEILEHCKRGTCNLRFQVRSGSSNPPTADFVGTDGTTGTYFTDASGEDTGINVSNNRYFQYKAYFSTENKRYTPELSSVTITYSLSGSGGGRPGPYIYQWKEIFE